jgi:hypothetical protein
MVIHTNFADGKILLIDVKYLYVNCNGKSRICAVKWIGVNMWCVNPHLTKKMLVRANSKFGHFNDRVLLPKESQISRAYDRHCSQLEYHCLIGLLKSNIRVMCL